MLYAGNLESAGVQPYAKDVIHIGRRLVLSLDAYNPTPNFDEGFTQHAYYLIAQRVLGKKSS